VCYISLIGVLLDLLPIASAYIGHCFAYKLLKISTCKERRSKIKRPTLRPALLSSKLSISSIFICRIELANCMLCNPLHGTLIIPCRYSCLKPVCCFNITLPYSINCFFEGWIVSIVVAPDASCSTGKHFLYSISLCSHHAVLSSLRRLRVHPSALPNHCHLPCR